MKKIGIWLIYIAVIAFILVYFFKIAPSFPKEDINAEAPFGLYKDMISMIKRQNYIFDYNITTIDKIIKYSGKKDGEKEQSEIYYNDELGDLESLNELIDIDLLNPNYVFDILENINDYTLDKENNKRTFTYNVKIEEKKMQIIIVTDLTSITNISIYDEKNTYDLKYENIGFTS